MCLISERLFDVPESLFNTCLGCLLTVIVTSKVLIRYFRYKQEQRQRIQRTAAASSSTSNNDPQQQKLQRELELEEEKSAKPEYAKAIQYKFLPVFWLLRTAFWMSGPYFYAVYASKIVNGVPASTSLISQIFLVGFAAIALIGPVTGKAFDVYGRKKGTIAATLVYSLGTLSTQTSSLGLLFVGRGVGGVGTSMLSNAPESWLVSEFQNTPDDGRWLYDTFGLAFSGDYIAAIIAGQIAGYAASYRGPTGPFMVSPFFLASGALVAAFFWKENKANSNNGGVAATVANPNEPADDAKEEVQSDGEISDDESTDSSASTDGSIQDALKIVLNDPKIMLVGAIQALFESSMYVFVMQWPPTLAIEIQQFYRNGSIAVPYGTVFSCFMACCLIGSTIFGQMAKMGVNTRTTMTTMLPVASMSLALATYAVWSNESTNRCHLVSLVAAFFIFEACVGMYFPSIGSLRSQYVPDSHRALIMTLFGVPLNVLVVAIFLYLHKLGSTGALGLSAFSLAVASLCMHQLNRIVREEQQREYEERRKKSQARWGKIATVVRSGAWGPLYLQDSQSSFVTMRGYGVQMEFKSSSRKRLVLNKKLS